MAQLEPELLIAFQWYDPWESDPAMRLCGNISYERLFDWPPLNWVDAYPFIYVDGEFYYYP